MPGILVKLDIFLARKLAMVAKHYKSDRKPSQRKFNAFLFRRNEIKVTFRALRVLIRDNTVGLVRDRLRFL